MKTFARSIPGKTILIIITIVSFCICLFGAAITVALIDDGVYDEHTKGTAVRAKVWESDEFYLQEVSWDVMRDVLIDCLRDDEVSTYPQEQFPIAFRIYDEEGKLIGSSEDYNPNQGTTEVHSILYAVLKGDPSTILTDALFIIEPYEDSEEFETVFRIDCYAREEASRSIYDQLVLWVYSHSMLIPIAALAGLLLGLIAFIGLMCVSGRHPHTEEVLPGPLDPVPYDLLTALIPISLWILFEVAMPFVDMPEFSVFLVVLLMVMVIGNAMSLACRIKRKTLIKGTIIYKVGRLVIRFLVWLAEGIKDMVRGLPLIWKSVLILSGLAIVDLIFAALCYSIDIDSSGFVMWICHCVVLIPIALWCVLCLKRLQQGGEKLASGDLEYHIDTNRMPYDLKIHGEHLNGIAKGMSLAVDKQVRSERMKTELLTNVSHDIKTPLTSIINYADLISKEQDDKDKVAQYAEVLTRQASRLKRLLEDLVEASKASTGNLEIVPEPTHMGVLLQQAAGEYEERMAELELTQVLEIPEQDIVIMADGRRMWRIFDNLMNNICKYAMRGTRVYIRLEEQEGQCVISFSNISREPLNINEEELMERFVRGDRSRNTEGSGLGLSIARSLTELQQGKLEIRIDGDLFKAILTFPIMQS